MGGAGRESGTRFPWTRTVVRALRDAARSARDRIVSAWRAFHARPESSRHRLRRFAFAAGVATLLSFAGTYLWVNIWLETTFFSDLARDWRMRSNRRATAGTDFTGFAPIRALIAKDVEAELDRRGVARGGPEEPHIRSRIERDLSGTYLEAAGEADRLAMFKFAANESRHSLADRARVDPASWIMLKIQVGDAHPLTRYAEGMVFLDLIARDRFSGERLGHHDFLHARKAIPGVLARIRAAGLPELSAEARDMACVALLWGVPSLFELHAFLRRFDPPGDEARVAIPVLESLAALDTTSAVGLIRSAADAGCPDARVAMGDLYDEGVFLPRDPEEADRWYRSAVAPGSSGKRAHRDSSREPVACFRSPLDREAPFGVLRFSEDGTEVIAASSTRVARFAVADPARAAAFSLPPLVALSEDGALALARRDTDTVALYDRDGAIAGTAELPASLRGTHLVGRFHRDGGSAWVTDLGKPGHSDKETVFSGARLELDGVRFSRVDEGFMRSAGVVRFAIRPDLSMVAVLEARSVSAVRFIPLPPSEEPIRFERIYPPREVDEEIGGRERGFGFPEERVHALADGRFLVVFGVEMKGTFHCYDWYRMDPERSRAHPSRYAGDRFASNDFEVVRSDGRWAFFEGYLEDHGWDGYLRDLDSLRATGTFPHPMRGVRAAAFSPSGRHLATTDGYLVKVWDLTRFAGYTLPVGRE